MLSVPYPLRFLFASRPAIMGRVLGIVYRCIATHLIRQAGFSRKTAQAGRRTGPLPESDSMSWFEAIACYTKTAGGCVHRLPTRLTQSGSWVSHRLAFSKLSASEHADNHAAGIAPGND